MNRRKFLNASLILTGSVALSACVGSKLPAQAAVSGTSGWDFVPFDELRYPFSLPSLPYSYDALNPVVDTDTMKIHHTKHHQAYIDKLNAAMATAQPSIQALPLTLIMENLSELPEPLQTAIVNHGGGHYNHTLFWQLLSAKAQEPSGKLLTLINDSFGSTDGLKAKLLEAGLSVFGSGWAWVIKGENQKLEITTTANQLNPLMPNVVRRGVPILGIDVWEHAYYLNYQNRRKDYLDALWTRLNWDYIGTLI